MGKGAVEMNLVDAKTKRGTHARPKAAALRSQTNETMAKKLKKKLPTIDHRTNKVAGGSSAPVPGRSVTGTRPQGRPTRRREEQDQQSPPVGNPVVGGGDINAGVDDEQPWKDDLLRDENDKARRSEGTVRRPKHKRIKVRTHRAHRVP